MPDDENWLGTCMFARASSNTLVVGNDVRFAVLQVADGGCFEVIGRGGEILNEEEDRWRAAPPCPRPCRPCYAPPLSSLPFDAPMRRLVLTS